MQLKLASAEKEKTPSNCRNYQFYISLFIYATLFHYYAISQQNKKNMVLDVVRNPGNCTEALCYNFRQTEF